MFELLIIAILPGFLLFSWIMYMDRREKEPLGLALKVMLAGALSAIPAAFFETSLSGLAFFAQDSLMGIVRYSFLKIAPIEELCKLGAALLVVWRDPHFNEENDGIAYVGASALGFATLENILYVMQGGLGLGVTRALTALPLHAFTGVMMGYFIGVAKFSAPEKVKSLILKGFLVAWFTHGLYNTLLITGTPIVLLAIPLVITIYIVGVVYLKQGRLLSLRRWGQGPAPICEAVRSETIVPAVSGCVMPNKRQIRVDRWKIVISRTILGSIVLFWVFLTWAYLEPGSGDKLTPEEFFGGGLIITFLPILIGILLETSYHRSRSRNLYQNRG
jgi:RsiW-degrading membrane proteinase PrsW (M82 family)